MHNQHSQHSQRRWLDISSFLSNLGSSVTMPPEYGMGNGKTLDTNNCFHTSLSDNLTCRIIIERSFMFIFKSELLVMPSPTQLARDMYGRGL
jgi:hypothetical protein